MDICLLNSEKTIVINGKKSQHKWGHVDIRDLETMDGINLCCDITHDFVEKVVEEFSLDKEETEKVKWLRPLMEIDYK